MDPGSEDLRQKRKKHEPKNMFILKIPITGKGRGCNNTLSSPVSTNTAIRELISSRIAVFVSQKSRGNGFQLDPLSLAVHHKSVLDEFFLRRSKRHLFFMKHAGTLSRPPATTALRTHGVRRLRTQEQVVRGHRALTHSATHPNFCCLRRD